MKILQNAGDFRVIAVTIPEGFSSTDPTEVIKKAGSTCYKSEGKTIKSPQAFTKMLLKKGHTSVIEHVSVSVLFLNISRIMTHELVRHRLVSYSQESTRYVDYIEDGNEPAVVVPPDMDIDKGVFVTLGPYITRLLGTELTPREMIDFAKACYDALRAAGWKAEDARFILPMSLKTEIVATANLTEWRHILRLRTQKAAYWEIRQVMNKILEDFKVRFAPIFDDFILAGEDEKGIAYYKIKGYCGDIPDMIEGAWEDYSHEKAEAGEDWDGMDFPEYLIDYYRKYY